MLHQKCTGSLQQRAVESLGTSVLLGVVRHGSLVNDALVTHILFEVTQELRAPVGSDLLHLGHCLTLPFDDDIDDSLRSFILSAEADDL